MMYSLISTVVRRTTARIEKGAMNSGLCKIPLIAHTDATSWRSCGAHCQYFLPPNTGKPSSRILSYASTRTPVVNMVQYLHLVPSWNYACQVVFYPNKIKTKCILLGRAYFSRSQQL